MIDPEGVLVASRFVLDGAAVFLWGLSAYLVTLPSRELRLELERRWVTASTLAIALAVVAVASQLPLHTAIIGNGWGSALDGAMAWKITTLTTTGLAWAFKAGIVSLACLAIMLFPARRLMILLIASLSLLASLALSGHSAMHTGWLGYLHRLNQWLHLLSSGFWLGALFPLVSTLRSLRQSAPSSPTLHESAIAALKRFSRMGHVAVAMVVVTGAINTALILGKLPLDWTQDYQRLLLYKMILVATMIGIALTNRYWLVPRISGNLDTLRSLERMTCVEVILAGTVLALVVKFSALAP